MFGTLVLVDSKVAVFHSVWTYAIKAVDGRKKVCWDCDGLPRSGQAKILDETCKSCVDQTSSRLFYAIAAVDNLLIFGAYVSNAFADTPPPKQGFYMYPDRAFHEWRTKHKQCQPIPPQHVMPILSTEQNNFRN